MTLQEAVPYLSLLLALLGFWLGRMSASKSEGERDGTLMTEVGYIKAGVDDIKKWQKEQEKQNLDIVERLSAAEASLKQAHYRINEIREHCCGD